jgi:hypothetical protein
MLYKPTIIIPGLKDGRRVDSRQLEATLQESILQGHRCLEIHAYGQHGIGGRLWQSGGEEILLRSLGAAGQRGGAMGFPGTTIDVFGPCSDDVGWLNAGARIVVRGHATNGVGNAMAQGKIYIAGDIGARGMTMTKFNPRFDPPELWVLGSVGDSFAEFMAGGTAVVCGHDTVRFQNVMGYRPCVGMVAADHLAAAPNRYQRGRRPPLPDRRDGLAMLKTNMIVFSRRAHDLYAVSYRRPSSSWQVLTARSRMKNCPGPLGPWGFCRGLGQGTGTGGSSGISLTFPERRPLVPTGDLRRFVPLWENGKYLSPCQAACPTGIPVQKRWRLLREGKAAEAVDLALAYTPFPATVCGYLCPNLCMTSCTRQIQRCRPDMPHWQGVPEARPPVPAPSPGKTVAL